VLKKNKILMSLILGVSISFSCIASVQAKSTIDIIKTNKYDLRTAWNIRNDSDKTLNDITINISVENGTNNNYCLEINRDYKPNNDIGNTEIIENKDENSKTYQLHINKLNPHQTINYYIDRTLEVDSVKYNISENDFNNINYKTTDNNIDKDISKYLDTSNYNYNNNKDKLINISKQLGLNNINNPYLKAKAIFEYVNTNIQYDTNEGNKGLSNVLRTNKGVCEEFSELFTALCRVNGISARNVYGYWLDSKNVGYNVWRDYNTEAHAWNEIYLPNYGWILVDATANKFNHNKVDFSYFANAQYQDHFVEGFNSLIDTSTYYSQSNMNVVGHIKIDKTKQLKKIS
jgi:Transglutaminase-like enzymes, putative cysteine proteases